MSDFMTAEEAINLVAPHVDLCPSRNRAKLFQLLSLANEHFWRKGKWHGMTKEFWIKVHCDGTIISPPGFNVLLGINIDGEPKTLRDQYYQFHRNGPGTLDGTCGDSNWTCDVVDLGQSPVIRQPIDDPHDPCNPRGCSRARIGVSGAGCDFAGAKVTVEGLYPTGHPVMSYFRTDQHGQRTLVPAAEGEKIETTNVVHGVEFEVGPTVQRCANVFWQNVSAITKTPTMGVVKVWAMYDTNRVSMIAELLPHETYSCYGRFRLPQSCRCNPTVRSGNDIVPCVLGLFKMSKPQPITMGSQRMIVNSSEAILSMAMAMDLWYEKRNPGASVPYENKALKAISEVTEESRTNATVPIQFIDVKAEAEVAGLGEFY